MTLAEAVSLFVTPARRNALDAMVADKGIRRVRLEGLAGSAPAMVASAMERKGKPMLVVADDADSAGYMYHDLCRIAGEEHVAFFPSGYRRDIKYGQVDPASAVLRTEALDAWNNGKETLRWLVTYPEALAEKVPVREKLADSTVILRSGAKCVMTDVLIRLRELGFKEVDYVYEPGQFARRGSIVDVFSFSNDLPYRIDFFDDEIDSMRTFNVETQLSEQRLKELSIVPAAPPGADRSEGVSMLEFVGDRTLMFCSSPLWLLQRVRAIAAEEYSPSAAIADEGDPEAMKRVVDADDFETRLGKFRIFQSAQSRTIHILFPIGIQRKFFYIRHLRQGIQVAFFPIAG